MNKNKRRWWAERDWYPPTDKRLKQQSDFPDIQAPLNLPTVD